jgi:RNA polymerase sigma factor (sigma-70 family)
MSRDGELLGRYVRDGAQEAFDELVVTHLHLVYASARRQLGDEALAEDVTQGVFLMLSMKAATMRADVVLPPWLLTVTWYACKNALRKERRRRIHEHAAAAVRREAVESETGSSADANRMLDRVLHSMGETDRTAVVMHYLQGRDFEQVASALHTTPEGARKRVERAVVKLRDRFAHAGVEFAAPAAVGSWLIKAAAVKAPAALLASMTAGQLAASGAAGVIAAEALRAMAMPTAKVAGAIGVATLCVGAVLISAAARVGAVNPTAATPTSFVTANSPAAPSPLVWSDAGRAPVPAVGAEVVTFPNALIAPIAATDTGYYAFGEDAAVKRQPDAAPAGFIGSLTPDGALMPGMRGWSLSAAAWRGKRIEVSAYLRTQDVRDATGMNVAVMGPRNKVLSSGMNGGPLRMAGTHEWTRMASVLDVPADAQRITFGVGVWGPGRLWIDSFAMRAVPDTVPLTSDAMWHLSTQFVSQYRLVSDAAELRNGHATARLELIGAASGAATKGRSAKVMRIERTTDALRGMRGKRVRIAAMIKAANVAGGAGPFVSAGHFDEQGRYSEKRSKPNLAVGGTTGWLRYATTLEVPSEAESLEYGVRIDGPGTVWVDDVVLKVLPNP